MKTFVGIVAFIAALTIIASAAYVVGGPGKSVMEVYNKIYPREVLPHDEGWVLPLGLLIVAVYLAIRLKKRNKPVDRVVWVRGSEVLNEPVAHSGLRRSNLRSFRHPS